MTGARAYGIRTAGSVTGDVKALGAVSVTGEGASFPPSATRCHKCNTKALVIMDAGATSLNCGYSKCG